MPPSTLQGLNIIHPAQDVAPIDSRDLLLGQSYPDLSAQLELWTSLNFESDDPLTPENNERKNSLRLLTEDEEDEARSPVTEENAIRDGHANVVTPTNTTSSDHHQNQNHPALINPTTAVAAAAAAQSFDLNAFLAGFGLDFAATAAPPHHPQLQQAHPQVIAPSLAQLLAFHSIHNAGYSPPGFLPYPVPPVDPSPAPTPLPHNAPLEEESYGSTKRARTRRSSMTTISPEGGSSTSGTTPSSPNSVTPSAHPSPPVFTPLSPAEDKRRRNTAASARFRLKKKEREAALESKAKELDTKVVELERECEALRRENGWLKGLVVGVTGAAAQAPTGQGLVTAPAPAAVSTGSKRSREETGSV